MVAIATPTWISCLLFDSKVSILSTSSLVEIVVLSTMMLIPWILARNSRFSISNLNSNLDYPSPRSVGMTMIWTTSDWKEPIRAALFLEVLVVDNSDLNEIPFDH